MISIKNRVTLEFQGLSYSVKEANLQQYTPFGFIGIGPFIGSQQKKILDNVSGTFKPGELTAIMGPSGAGKSTLLNVLAGHARSNVDGLITVNGEVRNYSKFRKQQSYIMQEDDLHKDLSVLEAMQYAAEIKLSTRTPKEEKEAIISEILQAIGLTEIQNSRSELLSGGQRKRLAIALELINNPPIMFFDEPTSGLDSATCTSCVEMLKSLARGGRTIIATIHQPSSRIVELFDSLYILADGKCMYSGSVPALVPYLAQHGLQCPPYFNPADFAIEVAIGNFGKECIQDLADSATIAFKNSLEHRNSKSPEPSSDLAQVPQVTFDKSNGLKAHNLFEAEHLLQIEDGALETRVEKAGDCVPSRYWNEFSTLLRRISLCTVRDRLLMQIRTSSTIFVALLVGAMYPSAGSDAGKVLNNAGNFFFTHVFLANSSIMSTVLAFPLERNAMVREYMNGWYSLKTYFFAKLVAELPHQVFFPSVYMLIVYLMTEQPLEFYRFGIICMIGVLVALTAQSYGFLIGSGFNVQNSVILGTVTTIPIFLFTGFFAILHTIPVYLRWISYISYTRYAFQSTLTALYGFDREELQCHEPYCHFRSPQKFLELFDSVGVNVWFQSGVLVLMIVVIRFLAYWVLRFKIHRSVYTS